MKAIFNDYILVYNSKVKILLKESKLESKIKNVCENYLMDQLTNDFKTYTQFKYPATYSVETWFKFRTKIIDKIINLVLYPPTKDDYPYIDKHYPYFSNLQYIQNVAFQYKNIVFYLLLFVLADSKYYNTFFRNNIELKKIFNKNYNTVNSIFKRVNIFGIDSRNQKIIKKYFKYNININKKFYLKINNLRYKLYIYSKFVGKMILYYRYILHIRYKPGGKGYVEAKETYYSIINI
jgi:hypothetical protein